MSSTRLAVKIPYFKEESSPRALPLMIDGWVDGWQDGWI